MRDPTEGWPTMLFAEPLTGATRWFAWEQGWAGPAQVRFLHRPTPSREVA